MLALQDQLAKTRGESQAKDLKIEQLQQSQLDHQVHLEETRADVLEQKSNLAGVLISH